MIYRSYDESGDVIDKTLNPIWHNRDMNLYPCTKNPPCKNVSGHLTPVCPNDTSGLNNTSASKLKADVLRNDHVSSPKVERRNDGSVKSMMWENGDNEDGIHSLHFSNDGNLIAETWDHGKGPGGLERRQFHLNRMLQLEQWESGKGPGDLSLRTYRRNGQVDTEEWEPGKGPDGLWYRSYYTTGGIEFERWELGKGPGGLRYRRYDKFLNIVDEG